jgi:hypothetical protein
VITPVKPSNKIDSIFTWPIFKSFKNVQIFLDFANFYKRFIKGYSEIAGFLTNLLKESELDKKKRGLFEFPLNAQQAFNELKTRFTIVPILRHFNLF